MDKMMGFLQSNASKAAMSAAEYAEKAGKDKKGKKVYQTEDDTDMSNYTEAELRDLVAQAVPRPPVSLPYTR